MQVFALSSTAVHILSCAIPALAGLRLLETGVRTAEGEAFAGWGAHPAHSAAQVKPDFDHELKAMRSSPSQIDVCDGSLPVLVPYGHASSRCLMMVDKSVVDGLTPR